MDFEVNKNELLKSLEAIQIATENKISMNNNGILMTVNRSMLYLEANCYNVGIRTITMVTGTEEGSVNVMAPQLISTLRMMPNGKVHITHKENENVLIIEKDSYKSKFPTRDYKEFPRVSNIKTMGEYTKIEVNKEEFIKAISQVSFASAIKKMGNPVFEGISIQTKKDSNKLVLNATDTRTLAQKTITLATPAEKDTTSNIQLNILNEVKKQLKECENDTIKMIISEKHVAFYYGNVYFMSNLINGTYPDVDRVIPKEEGFVAEVNLQNLTNAISFVNPISQNESDSIISLRFKENNIEITTDNTKQGIASTTVPCKNKLDKEIEVKYKSTFISNILKHSEGENIILHVLENKPLRFEQENDKDYIYIACPLRAKSA